MRKALRNFIDFFYFPFFRKWISKRNFTYLACGGTTTLVDILVFYWAYHYVIHAKELVHLPFVTVSGYIMAFIIAFCVSFPMGFFLSKYIVFPESYLRGRVQLFRYFLIVACNILFNYLLLHFFVQYLHVYPTVAKVIIVVLLALFSYFSQKYFTFRMEAKFYNKKKKD